jgi:hypothetical protein
MAGIVPMTFYRWLDDVNFVTAIEKAHAEFKKSNILAIRAAGIRKDKSGAPTGSWQANAWLMERTYPDEYGQRVTIRLTDEQSALLKENGLTAAEAFNLMIEELRAAKVK